MLVTVLTPSKNQGRYIQDCLSSVARQTHKNVEHIVLDALSNDETKAVVRRFPNVILAEGKDTGPAQAINKGLGLAKGEIVCWLNADDAFWDSTVLARVVSFFSEHSSVDVLTGDGYFITEDGRFLRPISAIPGRMTHEWLKRLDVFLQPATFWRRNDIRLDETLKFAFDWKLWLDFYDAGLNVCYLPERFGLYRIQPTSLTQLNPPLRAKEIYQIVKSQGSNPRQSFWCYLCWKGQLLQSRTRVQMIGRILNRANSVFDRYTRGRINNGTVAD